MTTSTGGLGATVGLIARDRELIERTRQAALELGVDLCVVAVPSGVVTSSAADQRPDCHESLNDLIAFAARCDVVTFEPSALSAAQREILHAAGITLRPGPHAAALADSSATARKVLRECGFDVVPNPDCGAVDSPGRQHGNTAAVRRSSPAVTWVGELSVVIARRPSGFRVVYPIVYPDVHPVVGRIQHNPPPPAATPASTVKRAINAAISITDGIDATGIVTVEFLLDNDDRPLVNSVQFGRRLEPQGISDPAYSSQFENHLRAILDWPLRQPTIGTPAP